MRHSRALLTTRSITPGFGTKYADPATFTGASATGVAFSPSGATIAVSHSSSPGISAYPFNLSTGIGARFANPASVLVSNGRSVAFHPSGNFVAVGYQATPFVIVYRWDDVTGFGERFNPATPPSGIVNSVAFSPDGNYISVAHATSPFFTVYPFSSTIGFGAPLSTSGLTLPTGQGNGIAWAPNGTLLGIAHNTSPFITVYPFNSGALGAKLANPSPAIADTAYSVTFRDGVIAIGKTTAVLQQIDAYQISASGFGTYYTNSASVGVVNNLAFSPSGNTLAATSNNNTVRATRWNNTSGAGVFYADLTLVCQAIAWHPTGAAIAIAMGATSPRFAIYPFNE